MPLSLSSISSIIGKIGHQKKPFLTPYTETNGFIGKKGGTLGLGGDGIRESKPPMSEDKKQAIEGITSQLGALGQGLASRSSAPSPQLSPLEPLNKGMGIQVPQFQLPETPVPSLQPIEVIRPTKPKDPLSELQSLIERQRGGM